MKKVLYNSKIYLISVSFFYMICLLLFYLFSLSFVIFKIILAVLIILSIYVNYLFISTKYRSSYTLSKNKLICFLVSGFIIVDLIVHISDYWFNNQIVNICMIGIISAYGVLVFSVVVLCLAVLIKQNCPVLSKSVYVFDIVSMVLGGMAICIRLFI